MTDAEPPAGVVVDALVQISFEVISVVTRVGAEHDLSLTLVRVLGILRDRTLTMAELADFLGLERSTVTGLIDRAERRGLVARTASQADGRSTKIALTGEGAELAQRASEILANRLTGLVGTLPHQVQDALPQLRDAMDRRRS